MSETQQVILDASNTIRPLDYDEFAADREATPPTLDYKALYEASQAENAVLQTIVTAKNSSAVVAKSEPDARPAVTYATLQKNLKPYEIGRMTDDQIAQVLGLEKAPTREELQRYFGASAKTADSHFLLKADPLRYRQLREYSYARPRW